MLIALMLRIALRLDWVLRQDAVIALMEDSDSGRASWS
jgi:hypothetical protein